MQFGPWTALDGAGSVTACWARRCRAREAGRGAEPRWQRRRADRPGGPWCSGARCAVAHLNLTGRLSRACRCANLWAALLRNAFEPFHRSLMHGTHAHVVSATHRTGRGCGHGVGEQRYTQNSKPAFVPMKIVRTILANCVCNKPSYKTEQTRRARSLRRQAESNEGIFTGHHAHP